MISGEDVGHILMVDVSIFLGSVRLCVGCDRCIAANDNVHIRSFNDVGRGLSGMGLQILQELCFPGRGSVGANPLEIVGQDTVECRNVRGALGLEPIVFDLLNARNISLVGRRCRR
jgi:hypothetical protein